MTHPYAGRPEHCFWRALPTEDWAALQPALSGKFQLGSQDRIATAGSCFAQNLMRRLQERGAPILMAEVPHPFLLPEFARRNGYGLFSARYGNIYTFRQLLELAEQAFGLRPPIHDHVMEGGKAYDLLRPRMQAESGFFCIEEARADREYHLTRVRAMFETLDVFIFTVGLTETWINRAQGHCYPACPGTVRGVYDPQLHAPVNLSHAACAADLDRFLAILRDANPAARVILTVSPVALVATHQDQHVLVATTHSKSALRSVCGEAAAAVDAVAYFPSYEIIASAASRGMYLQPDLREVTPEGVDHVMRCFFAAFGGAPAAPTRAQPAADADRQRSDLARRLVEADCDEMFNDVPLAGST